MANKKNNNSFLEAPTPMLFENGGMRDLKKKQREERKQLRTTKKAAKKAAKAATKAPVKKAKEDLKEARKNVRNVRKSNRLKRRINRLTSKAEELRGKTPETKVDVKPKPTPKVETKKVEPKKKITKVKKDPYAEAAKKDPNLASYVAKRKTLEKGSDEWKRNQNKINEAYGVSKRYEVKKKEEPKKEEKKNLGKEGTKNVDYKIIGNFRPDGLPPAKKDKTIVKPNPKLFIQNPNRDPYMTTNPGMPRKKGGMKKMMGGGMKKMYMKGGQSKLDMNKDGKLSGADFKMLGNKNKKMGGGMKKMYKKGGRK